jgi:HEAT repeat protein
MRHPPEDHDKSYREYRRLLGARDSKDVVALVEMAGDEAIREIWRTGAMHTLGKIGDARALEPLQRLARTGTRDVRVAALVALGNLRVPAAESVLVELLQDEDRAIATWAAVGLGKLGLRSSVAPLVRALDSDEWGIRLDAARALSRIGDPVAKSALRALRRRERGRRKLKIWLAMLRLAMCGSRASTG